MTRSLALSAVAIAALSTLTACPGGASSPPTVVSSTGGTPGAAYAPGELVLGQFRGGPFWFPARAETSDGASVALAYLDGDRETLPAGAVRRFDWQVGTRVECNWQRRGKFFPGTIAQLAGDQAHIQYDDGDQETLMIGFCRTR
jgi:hypothetical protein